MIGMSPAPQGLISRSASPAKAVQREDLDSSNGARVLFIHGTLEIGGAEEVRLALLSHLDRARYQATVCCLQRGGQIAEEVAALGCEVIVLGHRAHAFSLGTLAALRRLIQERRPHIVQTSLPRANYWGRMAAALERAPVIIAEEHNIREKSDRARPVIERVLGPRTDCVIAVSQSVRSAVAAMDRASARRPTVVIPNPVNARRLQPQRSRADVRRELRVSDDETLIVHTGRMESFRGQKGQDILIEAMAALPSTMSAVLCALIGDGPARRQLERMAQELGVATRVRFLGYRRDVADFLAAADLFVFPSRWEGMPIALMEAMWMGLPVVASDISASRETLGQGEYGRLVHAESPGALAEAIAGLLGDTRARIELGLRAQTYARNTFAPERYAKTVSELWEHLLALKAGGAHRFSQGSVRR